MSTLQYLKWMALSAGVCGMLAVLGQVDGQDTSSGPPATPGEATRQEPPLLLEDEPLLLEDEPDEAARTGPAADNSRCEVCHLNFAAEPLALTHAREQIGCADCHGDCDDHIDDESWASGGPGTPPEVMYPPERIDKSCRDCHGTHDVPALEVLQRWQDRCPEKKDPSTINCTDCHGQHRLKAKLRKAWWNKRTGEPIPPPARAGQQPAERSNGSPDRAPR